MTRCWRCWPASWRRSARTARRWPTINVEPSCELSTMRPTRYGKVSHDPGAIESLFVELFLEARRRRPNRSSSTSMPPTIRCTATRKAGSSMDTTMGAIATCRSTFSVAGTCWRPSCRRSNADGAARRSGRGCPHRGLQIPPSLAEDAHSAAQRRFRLHPGRFDGMVPKPTAWTTCSAWPAMTGWRRRSSWS